MDLGRPPQRRTQAEVERQRHQVAPVEGRHEARGERLRRQRVEGEVAAHLVEGEQPLLAGQQPDRLGRAVRIAQRLADGLRIELRGVRAQQGEQLLAAAARSRRWSSGSKAAAPEDRTCLQLTESGIVQAPYDNYKVDTAPTFQGRFRLDRRRLADEDREGPLRSRILRGRGARPGRHRRGGAGALAPRAAGRPSPRERPLGPAPAAPQTRRHAVRPRRQAPPHPLLHPRQALRRPLDLQGAVRGRGAAPRAHRHPQDLGEGRAPGRAPRLRRRHRRRHGGQGGRPGGRGEPRPRELQGRLRAHPRPDGRLQGGAQAAAAARPRARAAAQAGSPGRAQGDDAPRAAAHRPPELRPAADRRRDPRHPRRAWSPSRSGPPGGPPPASTGRWWRAAAARARPTTGPRAAATPWTRSGRPSSAPTRARRSSGCGARARATRGCATRWPPTSPWSARRWPTAIPASPSRSGSPSSAAARSSSTRSTGPPRTSSPASTSASSPASRSGCCASAPTPWCASAARTGR